MSVSSSGAQVRGLSGGPVLSADGRLVAFTSWAPNLVKGDTNKAPDAFVHNRRTGRTRLVSTSSHGVQGNDSSFVGSVSADGRLVAFFSDATNLVPRDTNGFKMTDVFVRDRSSGTTRLVSRSSAGVQGKLSSYSGSISPNGRLVAFYSSARNLVWGDTNEADDIFVRDLVSKATRRVSVSSAGAQANSDSGPGISAGGRFVVFESDASNLVAGDTNEWGDVFLRDLVTGTTERISLPTGS